MTTDILIKLWLNFNKEDENHKSPNYLSVLVKQTSCLIDWSISMSLGSIKRSLRSLRSTKDLGSLTPSSLSSSSLLCWSFRESSLSMPNVSVSHLDQFPTWIESRLFNHNKNNLFLQNLSMYEYFSFLEVPRKKKPTSYNNKEGRYYKKVNSYNVNKTLWKLNFSDLSSHERSPWNIGFKSDITNVGNNLHPLIPRTFNSFGGYKE